MRCAQCHQPLEDSDAFCPQCGTPRTADRTCAHCGGTVKATQKYCKHCGKPLDLYCSHCGACLKGDQKYCSCCGQKAHQQSSTPVCSNCGISLEINSSFCGECGQHIPVSSHTTSAPCSKEPSGSSHGEKGTDTDTGTAGNGEFAELGFEEKAEKTLVSSDEAQDASHKDETTENEKHEGVNFSQASHGQTHMSTGQAHLPDKPQNATDVSRMASGSSLASGNQAEASSGQTQTSRNMGQMPGDQSQMTSSQLQASGDQAQASSDQKQISSDSAQMSSDQSQIPSDLQTSSDQAQASNDQAQASRYQAQASSDQTSVPKDSAQVSSDQSQIPSDLQASSDQAQASSDQAQASSDQTRASSDKNECTTSNKSSLKEFLAADYDSSAGQDHFGAAGAAADAQLVNTTCRTDPNTEITGSDSSESDSEDEENEDDKERETREKDGESAQCKSKRGRKGGRRRRHANSRQKKKQKGKKQQDANMQPAASVIFHVVISNKFKHTEANNHRVFLSWTPDDGIPTEKNRIEMHRTERFGECGRLYEASVDPKRLPCKQIKQIKYKYCVEMDDKWEWEKVYIVKGDEEKTGTSRVLRLPPAAVLLKGPWHIFDWVAYPSGMKGFADSLKKLFGFSSLKKVISQDLQLACSLFLPKEDFIISTLCHDVDKAENSAEKIFHSICVLDQKAANTPYIPVNSVKNCVKENLLVPLMDWMEKAIQEGKPTVVLAIFVLHLHELTGEHLSQKNKSLFCKALLIRPDLETKTCPDIEHLHSHYPTLRRNKEYISHFLLFVVVCFCFL